MINSSAIRETSSKIGVKTLAILTGSIVVLSLIYKSYKRILLDFKSENESACDPSDEVDNLVQSMNLKISEQSDETFLDARIEADQNSVDDGLLTDVLINQIKLYTDDGKLLRLLQHVTNQAAFVQFQKSFGDRGGIPLITDLLEHRNIEIKKQAVLVINNLAMNSDNHLLLKDSIPSLIKLISSHDEDDLKMAIARALTNLTTLEIGQIAVLKSISTIINVFQNAVACKLQLMKIMVNITCDVGVDQDTVTSFQQIFDVSSTTLIESQLAEEEILVKSLFCIKNLMSTGNFSINDELIKRLQELSAHENLRSMSNEILILDRESSMSSITDNLDVGQLEESFSKLSLKDSD